MSLAVGRYKALTASCVTPTDMTAARSIIAVLLCSAAVVCVVEGCGFHYPAVVGREQEGDAPEGDAPAPFTVSVSCQLGFATVRCSTAIHAVL